MRINVTQEDIDKAASDPSSPDYARYCPVALAIKRLPQITYISVGSATATLKTEKRFWKFRWDKKSYIILLPKKVSSWIRKYDAYGKYAVKPLSFELNLKDQLVPHG